MRHKRKYINQETRSLVWRRYDGHCAYCGCELPQKDMVVDHFIPVSRWKRLHKEGDSDNIFNYMPSCASCNYWKGAKSPGGFKKHLSDQIQILYKDSAAFRNLIKYGLIYQSDRSVKFYYERYPESEKWCEALGVRPKLPLFGGAWIPITERKRFTCKDCVFFNSRLHICTHKDGNQSVVRNENDPCVFEKEDE